jgi:hypothetical protein
VTDLFEEFLSNAKVADYSVPVSTLERVAEMMATLRDSCLKPLSAVCVERANVSVWCSGFIRKLGVN